LSALEARLAYFESLTQNLKKASNVERNDLLAGVTLDDHLEHSNQFIETQEDNESPMPSDASGGSHAIALHTGPQGTLQFHGPTSIYLDTDGSTGSVETRAKTNVPSPPNLEAFSILRLASSLGVDDPLIQETLPLFFLFQYPQYLFVYREAFLSDYYDNVHGGRYWSFALVYSMCALGAPHSNHADIREKKHLLAKCAQEIIMTHCLTKPSPTTIQALLCLAFHEVGQGNASQGWLFSGMAFRMGHDLGFHQDPMRWISQDRSIITPEDIEIRRRIYWGSYVADKFISLYLGRPVYLREDDATVHPSEPLPDFPSDHNWFGFSEIASQYASSDPQKPQLIQALKHMVLLGKIFQDMMADIFSQSRASQRNEAHRLNKLGDLNVKLNRWHTSLPDGLQWSQWSTTKNTRTHVLVLHLYYSALVLSLNRYFVKPSAGFPSSPSSREICSSSCSTIMTLVRQFRSQQSLQTAPLMLVYALVMAIITRVQTLDHERESVTFLIRALDECARCYKLAAEARSRILSSLSTFNCPRGSDMTNTEAEIDLHTTPKDVNLEEQESSTGVEGLEVMAQNYDLDISSGAFASNGLGDDLVINTNPFDIGDFSDMVGDFQGWFSIGRMG
jgi:hypothetical protein